MSDDAMKTNGIAIVFGLSPTGLSVARSLALHGVTVYGVDSLNYEVGHFSNSVKHDRRFSWLPPGPALLDALVAFGRECEARPVIFNANDQYIDFVAGNRKALEPFFFLTESMRPEVNTVFLNKRTFYETCSRLKVAMPQTFFPVSFDEAKEAAKLLRYPAIVKPSHGYKLRHLLRGRKLIEVSDARDLLSWWTTFEKWGADVVLQECIPGPETAIAVGGLYMDRSGRCLSLFTSKKYRQYPPQYGSGTYMEAKWLPDVAELSVALMSHLHYCGVCGTEYKWDDRDQCWKLIEVNCRPTQWFALTRAAGVDVVWDAYCDIIGKPNAVHGGVQDDSVRWQLFVRDVASALHFLRKGELGWREFWRTVIDQRKKEWAICSWSDWGANFGYVYNTIMQVWVNYIHPPKK